MTAVLENILAEIVELSGRVTKDNQKKRFSPMSIVIAIHHDPDLRELLDQHIRHYIPTASELKSLGGRRWAEFFMDGKDPFTTTTKNMDTAAQVFTRYHAWLTSHPPT